MDKQKQNFNGKSVYGSTSIAHRFNLLCAIANYSVPFTAYPLCKHSREGIRTKSNKNRVIDLVFRALEKLFLFGSQQEER